MVLLCYGVENFTIIKYIYFVRLEFAYIKKMKMKVCVSAAKFFSSGNRVIITNEHFRIDILFQ